MPSNVRNFMLLAYLTLAIGIVTLVLHFDQINAMAAAKGMTNIVIAVDVIIFGLFAALIGAASFGAQNWARWVYAVLFAIGLPFAIFGMPTMFQRDVVQAVTGIIQMVLQAVAIFLVFTGNAKDWYRKPAE
jgi:protein-S-isoprenylcysteine O-methyltransferase Ste14